MFCPPVPAPHLAQAALVGAGDAKDRSRLGMGGSRPLAAQLQDQRFDGQAWGEASPFEVEVRGEEARVGGPQLAHGEGIRLAQHRLGLARKEAQVPDDGGLGAPLLDPFLGEEEEAELAHE